MFRSRLFALAALGFGAVQFWATPSARAENCPIITIGQGQVSGFGLNRPRFKGAECAILTPGAWQVFWAKHTSHLDDPPPPPPVNFQEYIVLAAIQGRQDTRNGPNIEIVGVRHGEHLTNVRIFDDDRPGDVDEISNPFHIVKVPRNCVFPTGGICFNRIFPPPPGEVEGHVTTETDDGSQPVAGARVRLIRNGHIVRQRLTNEAGAYGFANVPVGPYHMLVTKEGFLPATAEVIVHPNQTTVQDFVLEPVPPPGSVEGTVFGDTPDGEVPLAGALVRLIRQGHVVRQAMTNDDGAYVMEEVPPGPYLAVATKEGFLPGQAEIVVESEQTTTQDFVLEPVPPPGSVEGTVFGDTPDGEVPLEGALLRLIHNGHVVRQTLTNEAGEYIMENVRPGEYVLRAFKPGYLPGTANIVVESEQTTTQDFLLEPQD